MKHKKSQTEILGLAVIVVFITIGLLFAIKFMLNKPQESVREEFIHSELASNILGSTIDATTSCRGQDIADLLRDCAENNPGKVQCSEKYSCTFVEQEINNILFNFLGAMGGEKKYKFKAFLEEEVLFELKQGNCTVWESANQPLPTRKGTLNIQFQMCK